MMYIQAFTYVGGCVCFRPIFKPFTVDLDTYSDFAIYRTDSNRISEEDILHNLHDFKKYAVKRTALSRLRVHRVSLCFAVVHAIFPCTYDVHGHVPVNVRILYEYSMKQFKCLPMYMYEYCMTMF